MVFDKVINDKSVSHYDCMIVRRATMLFYSKSDTESKCLLSYSNYWYPCRFASDFHFPTYSFNDSVRYIHRFLSDSIGRSENGSM